MDEKSFVQGASFAGLVVLLIAAIAAIISCVVAALVFDAETAKNVTTGVFLTFILTGGLCASMGMLAKIAFRFTHK